jgi:hypothetical protein
MLLDFHFCRIVTHKLISYSQVTNPVMSPTLYSSYCYSVAFDSENAFAGTSVFETGITNLEVFMFS